MRTEAADVLTVRTKEADERVAEIVATAEQRVREMSDGAAAESDAKIEAARTHGREMLDEAKAARERVLGDLVKRRALLNAQIEVLRDGRDQLLDAYRTVKRAFLEATEALTTVESRAAQERSAAPGEPLDVAAEIAAEIEALDADRPELDVTAETAQVVDSSAEVGASQLPLADVDSLFARLRSVDDAAAPARATSDEVAVAEDATEDVGELATPSGGVLDLTEPELAPAVAADGEATVTAGEWREIRARAVDPVLGPLLKKAKRVAQDDQNALLDAVRRHKGRPTAAQVLPELDDLLEAWAGVLSDAVHRAYEAGSDAVGVPGCSPDDALAREAADALVSPLRLRVTVAIDSGEAGDAGGLVERIGARYREWKNQSLERSLTDVLALAWSRGVYEAVPDGAVLWWVPFEEGRCSDCDDNALEPTVKGKEFPTGQPFPPAHPGCRCLLAPAAILNSPTASA